MDDKQHIHWITQLPVGNIDSVATESVQKSEIIHKILTQSDMWFYSLHLGLNLYMCFIQLC